MNKFPEHRYKSNVTKRSRQYDSPLFSIHAISQGGTSGTDWPCMKPVSWTMWLCENLPNSVGKPDSLLHSNNNAQISPVSWSVRINAIPNSAMIKSKRNILPFKRTVAIPNTPSLQTVQPEKNTFAVIKKHQFSNHLSKWNCLLFAKQANHKKEYFWQKLMKKEKKKEYFQLGETSITIKLFRVQSRELNQVRH